MWFHIQENITNAFQILKVTLPLQLFGAFSDFFPFKGKLDYVRCVVTILVS